MIFNGFSNEYQQTSQAFQRAIIAKPCDFEEIFHQFY